MDEFDEQFETFSYTAFRLETHQHYADTGPAPEWAALVKANRGRGKIHQRVHVVIEPLSGGMREELTAGYWPNVAAGEDIRVIPVSHPALRRETYQLCPAQDYWPTDIPGRDFWLFDSSTLYVMHYDRDGAWTGAERITDTGWVVDACRIRDAALHSAVAWAAYIASRADLQRLLARHSSSAEVEAELARLFPHVGEADDDIPIFGPQ